MGEWFSDRGKEALGSILKRMGVVEAQILPRFVVEPLKPQEMEEGASRRYLAPFLVAFMISENS